MARPYRKAGQQPRDGTGTLNIPTLDELRDAMRPTALPVERRANRTVREWADHFGLTRRHTAEVLEQMVKTGVAAKADPLPVPIGGHTRWVPSYELNPSAKRCRRGTAGGAVQAIRRLGRAVRRPA